MKFSGRQVRFLAFAALALLTGLLLPPAAALAQGAQVELSEAQVNQIVEQVTGAVLKELKAGPPPAPSSPPAGGAKPSLTSEQGFAAFLQGEEYQVLSHFEIAVRAFPELLTEMASIAARTDRRPEGHGPFGFMGMVAGVFAAGLALAYASAAMAHRWLPGGTTLGGPASIGQTLRRAWASIAGFAVFWLVVTAAAGKLFPGPDMQSIVGHWLLRSMAQFALLYTAFLICFRPQEPAYRIVPLDGDDARLAMRLFTTVAAVSVLRSWIVIPLGDDQPAEVIAAGLLLNNLLFVSTFFAAALPARGAIARWIENTAMTGRVTPFRHWLAASWLTMAGSGVLAVAAIHAYGAIMGHDGVMGGLNGTVRAVILMILVCALVEFVGRRSLRAEQPSTRTAPKLPGLVSRMLRVLIILGAAIYFLRLWAVDALQVMSGEQWSNLASYAFEPLAALFCGYLAVSYVNYAAARYLASHPRKMATVNDDGDVVSPADGSSRLRTLVPIMRITANVIIIVMIGLLALSHLGFDITPLLAGASVIGLAISFGSQALVKDIVSGVLFLAEDSFRIGEYIECGNARGTVEGFTLRSVRLRHQDGQIFTVPFGQIGEIVNFSRDWSTVKFNMSLDRDVDLEDVRRVAATVATGLKADYRDRLLESLKVQGVKDVTDTAIVVQFKFTTVPRDPGEIERAARSRLLKAFKDEGIALSRHPWITAATAQPA